jgi:hypothetical protein
MVSSVSGCFSMKDAQLYKELKNLAEQLDVVVTEHNFKNTGVRVKSGSCLVKKQKHCIIDKHIRIQKKIAILTECLDTTGHENVFVVPAIRDHLDQFAKRVSKGRAATAKGKEGS